MTLHVRRQKNVYVHVVQNLVVQMLHILPWLCAYSRMDSRSSYGQIEVKYELLCLGSFIRRDVVSIDVIIVINIQFWFHFIYHGYLSSFPTTCGQHRVGLYRSNGNFDARRSRYPLDTDFGISKQCTAI